jgi:[acyl-carrier-protein] S-malonyltransferase
MGKQLCDRFTVAQQVFAEADDALGFPLGDLCFGGPEAELKLTENTQPAILAVSVAALTVLQTETELRPAFVAGHSLGEYSALVAVGALSLGDAIRVVRARGRLMQEAVPLGRGAMAVVLGLAVETVRALCAEASQDELVAPANYNGGGQVVIAGTREAVARAATLARQAGAKRVLDLAVSAPFHCELMRSAADGLERVLSEVPVHPFDAGVVTNVEAEVNLDPGRIKSLLVEQVIRPVRWEESVQKLAALGCRRAIEVGPGKVLRGLIRRIEPTMEVAGFESPDDLPSLAGQP